MVERVLLGNEVWFRKSWSTSAVQGSGTFLGEAIGYLLAQAVGVATPKFGVDACDRTAWLSKDVGAAWKPLGAGAQAFRELGGILMLDAVLCNSDRHSMNLGVANGRVSAFDFDKSPLGVPLFAEGYSRPKVQKTIPPQTLEGVDIDEAVNGASTVAAALHALCPSDIEKILRAALFNSPDSEGDLEKVLPVLEYRCTATNDLLDLLVSKLRRGVDGWLDLPG
jgi:hypothetical protein